MSTLTTLAVALQALFTTTAVRLGRVTHLFQRQRLLTADDFARTLVFGWIERPRASRGSFAIRLDLSTQALQQRMTLLPAPSSRPSSPTPSAPSTPPDPNPSACSDTSRPWWWKTPPSSRCPPSVPPTGPEPVAPTRDAGRPR